MEIVRATYLKDYQYEFEFIDGKVVTIDFRRFLFESDDHPCITPFQDIEKFKKYTLDEDGHVSWGDNEMDFNPIGIYEGKDPEPHIVTEEMKQQARDHGWDVI